MPIYRTDSSGTTDNVQKYLTAAAPQSWTQGVGTGFQGGVGEGAAKSAGVIQAVRATPGAIGYVEKGFADQAGMPYAQIDNGSGLVPLTNDTARNAVNAAHFVASGNDLVLDLNSVYGIRAPGAYPLVLATYEIVCSKGYDPDTAGRSSRSSPWPPTTVRAAFPRPAMFRCPIKSRSAGHRDQRNAVTR